MNAAEKKQKTGNRIAIIISLIILTAIVIWTFVMA